MIDDTYVYILEWRNERGRWLSFGVPAERPSQLDDDRLTLARIGYDPDYGHRVRRIRASVLAGSGHE